jgi:antitoxin (DNA-binding transcriptional repressor) of toxin-antitoxin stability system
MCHIMCHIEKMPRMNLRELRDTRQLKAWLRAGKTVELRDRNELLGRIVPVRSEEPVPERPDFAARLKARFGDRVLPGNIVSEERGRY